MGNAFKQWQTESDYTQAQLAAEFEVTQATISRWLNGVVTPKKVKAVSGLSGLSAHQLNPVIFDQ